MLHLDLPTDVELSALARRRHPASVSIALPTTPVTPDTAVDRLAFRALALEAIAQLEAIGFGRDAVEALGETFDDLTDDDAFWRFQTHAQVVFATPENLITYRLPTTVEPLVAVSDRFHLEPLLRSRTFANTCYVLALAEGKKVRLRQYARLVDHVLRDRLAVRGNQGRASTDVAQVARTATFEAVQSLMVDMDRVMNGRIDETDGRIDEAETAGADSYGVYDEIARRVLLSGGEVLGVRQEDLPEGDAVAAILRYSL